MRISDWSSDVCSSDLHPLRRFLPYLWPEGQRRLKARVIAAIMLVLLAKATVLTMPFAYKGAIDRMAPGMEPGVAIAVALILAYAAARFGAVLFDNLRNAIFARLGPDAARPLSVDGFSPIHPP